LRDPTHGRIDPDIQRYVEEMEPRNLGQRVAIENTLQRRRDDGLVVLGVERGSLNPPTTAYRIGWWTHKWWPTRELLWRALTGRVTVDTIHPVTVRSSRKAYRQALWRRVRLIRRPHRPWQAEMAVPGCSCNARRALTADGAVKRAKALHVRRMAAPLEPGTPVGGVKGKCWASLTEAERAAC
jgi:hypothetical protein